MGAQIAMPEISLNTQGLSFRKVACSRHDVASKMFQTNSAKSSLTDSEKITKHAIALVTTVKGKHSVYE
jgi:hypothetical protein